MREGEAVIPREEASSWLSSIKWSSPKPASYVCVLHVYVCMQAYEYVYV